MRQSQTEAGDNTNLLQNPSIIVNMKHVKQPALAAVEMLYLI